MSMGRMRNMVWPTSIWVYLRGVRVTLFLEVALQHQEEVLLGHQDCCQNDLRQYLPEREMGTLVIFNCAMPSNG